MHKDFNQFAGATNASYGASEQAETDSVGIGAPLSTDVETVAEHRPRRVVFTLRGVQTGATTVI
jgi:hypothetical protein